MIMMLISYSCYFIEALLMEWTDGILCEKRHFNDPQQEKFDYFKVHQ